MWLTNNYLIKALHDPSVALQKNLSAKFCCIEMQYETALNHKFSEFNKRKCKKIFSSNASSWPYALITYRPQTCFLLTIIGSIKSIAVEWFESAGASWPSPPPSCRRLAGNTDADMGPSPRAGSWKLPRQAAQMSPRGRGQLISCWPAALGGQLHTAEMAVQLLQSFSKGGALKRGWWTCWTCCSESSVFPGGPTWPCTEPGEVNTRVSPHWREIGGWGMGGSGRLPQLVTRWV